jgi:hypothetical protein
MQSSVALISKLELTQNRKLVKWLKLGSIQINQLDSLEVLVIPDLLFKFF